MSNSSENLYRLDGRVPLGKALPFGLQHVLAMFVSNITPIMILAAAVGLDSAVSAALIQNCMVIAGIGTLVQLFPVWRIGSRLPIVMGISFTFLSLAIGIAGTYGMGTLIGAVIVGGLVEGLLGLFVKSGSSSSRMSFQPPSLRQSASRFCPSEPTRLQEVWVRPTSAA